MNSSADWSGLTDAGDGTARRTSHVPLKGSGTPAADGDWFGDGIEPQPDPGGAGKGARRGDGTPTRRPGAQRTRGGGSRVDADADPEAQARTIVLRQLTGSAKSRKQLEDKLAEKDIPADSARAVLDRFEELQLVDDAAFADAWVRSRFRTRGLSRSALRRELREKGIDDALSDDALQQVDGDDEFDAARELVERKLRTMSAAIDRDTAVRRLVAMLGRKGYGAGIAYRVADHAWAQRQP